MPRRYSGRNMFRSMENLKQEWWYFELDEDDNLRLADKNKFKHRPSDANPDQGNPYTPWYELEDHYNDEHIHIKAVNYPRALKKAIQIKENNKNTNPQTTRLNILR
jgi:hypothetical protein